MLVSISVIAIEIRRGALSMYKSEKANEYYQVAHVIHLIDYLENA